jgi:hypothetical protein
MRVKSIKSPLFILSLLAIGILGASPAYAAKPAPSTPVLLGNDISYPQCKRKLPSGQAFGVVGVNDGLANTTNPCFATELSWAQQSKGGTGQDKAALYVNTANPGLAGSYWPHNNDYGGVTVSSPYGTCDGGDNAACAYMYGYAKAYDDATIRGVSNPSGYMWWLDVETVNSWETNKAANSADLEGMTAYFQSIHARVGVYSTGYQWGQIVGSTGDTSNLNGLQSWLAGASSRANAQSFCSSSAPLTTNGIVSMAQFVSANLDSDYSCI